MLLTILIYLYLTLAACSYGFSTFYPIRLACSRTYAVRVSDIESIHDGIGMSCADVHVGVDPYYVWDRGRGICMSLDCNLPTERLAVPLPLYIIWACMAIHPVGTRSYTTQNGIGSEKGTDK